MPYEYATDKEKLEFLKPRKQVQLGSGKHELVNSQTRRQLEEENYSTELSHMDALRTLDQDEQNKKDIDWRDKERVRQETEREEEKLRRVAEDKYIDEERKRKRQFEDEAARQRGLGEVKDRIDRQNAQRAEKERFDFLRSQVTPGGISAKPTQYGEVPFHPGAEVHPREAGQRAWVKPPTAPRSVVNDINKAGAYPDAVVAVEDVESWYEQQEDEMRVEKEKQVEKQKEVEVAQQKAVDAMKEARTIYRQRDDLRAAPPEKVTREGSGADKESEESYSARKADAAKRREEQIAHMDRQAKAISGEQDARQIAKQLEVKDAEETFNLPEDTPLQRHQKAALLELKFNRKAQAKGLKSWQELPGAQYLARYLKAYLRSD